MLSSSIHILTDDLPIIHFHILHSAFEILENGTFCVHIHFYHNPFTRCQSYAHVFGHVAI